MLSWLESQCLGHPQSTHRLFIVDQRPVATATFDKVVESLCVPVCFCVRPNGEEGSAIHPGAHVTLEGKQCTLNHLWCRMGYLNFQPVINWCFLSLCMHILTITHVSQWPSSYMYILAVCSVVCSLDQVSTTTFKLQNICISLKERLLTAIGSYSPSISPGCLCLSFSECLSYAPCVNRITLYVQLLVCILRGLPCYSLDQLLQSFFMVDQYSPRQSHLSLSTDKLVGIRVSSMRDCCEHYYCGIVGKSVNLHFSVWKWNF